MSKANLNFNDTKVKNSRFYNSKYSINIDKKDIKKQSYLTKFNGVKKVLNTLLVIRMMIKLNQCA